jgi:Right handed beta helix region/Protein of unknown function (DUF1565)
MKRKISILTWVAVLLLVPVGSIAETIHIPGDFPTIQEGIDAAQSGDTVLVADGTYTGDGNKNLSWSGQDKHITLQSENGCDGCIIDCEEEGSGIVLFSMGTAHADVIDGFTITNGTDAMAGGMLCNRASPIIRNCRFQGNVAESGSIGYGGGIYFLCSSALLEDCEFTDNEANFRGGGIYCYDSNVRIDRCRFSGNIATGTGGGLNCIESDPVILDCIFSENLAVGGAGVSISYGSPVITGCRFELNRASYGGGIQCRRGAEPVIGGDVETANEFIDNYAYAGCDISCSEPDDVLISAANNHFSGCSSSDYYVSPPCAFDLTGCTAGTELINQDVYVKPDGDDTWDGLAWETAFKTLTHALSVIGASTSNPLTIHLGPGTFSPSVTGETFPLPMLRYVSITGQGRVVTILDGEGSDTLMFLMNDLAVEITDLTLTGGNGSYGGALNGWASSVMLDSCDIIDNQAYSASAMSFSNGSTPVLTDCVISGNTAEYGLAAFSALQSSVEMNDCTISENTGLFGGGIYDQACNSEYNECVITDNIGGGAILMFSEDTRMRDCVISGNQSDDQGAGVQVLSSSADFENCILSGNQSMAEGGAFFVGHGAKTTIVNCTVTGNESTAGGGLYTDESRVTVTNTILWNNTPGEIGVTGPDPEVTYCDVQGGWLGKGTIDLNPRFSSGIDFHLTGDSPCIDSGTEKGAPESDVDGRERPLGGAFDMGAYEYDGYPSNCRVYLRLPDHAFVPGDTFSIDVLLWSTSDETFQAYPLFVLLTIGDMIFFMPGFNDFDYYAQTIPSGLTTVPIVSPFTWPQAGSGFGNWYAAVTDPGMTRLMWNLAEWDFNWSP